MLPDTVLDTASDSDTDRLLGRWLAEYSRLAEENPEKEDEAVLLSERVRLAHILISNGKRSDEPELDLELPLCNEFDAEFANRFFTVEELACIQIGFPWFADYFHLEELPDTTDIRKGFIQEMRGDYTEAVRYYKKVGDRSMLGGRLEYAQRKNNTLAEEYYQKAQQLIREKKYDDVYYYLWRAADMGHLEAQTERAMTEALGINGSDQCITQAKEHMRQAAENGDERARKLLEDGFDDKSRKDFLLDKLDAGYTEALWELYCLCYDKGDEDEAAEWLSRALEAEQPDALYNAALSLVNEESSDDAEQLAAEYLYKAAMQGHADAMLKCASLLEKAHDAKEKGNTILSLYEQAAEAGSIDAVEKLYQLYTFGSDFNEPNKEKSAYYAFMSGRYHD